ncbi:MAG: hypothetical protein GY936_07760 [Ignavibacteriae bacterium]|nr:hypothetical protein [Ignavibacteriota bacterium]
MKFLNSNKIAKIISYIFIPPLMNLVIFSLFANQIEPIQKTLVFVSSIVFGLVLPLVTIIILLKSGNLSNDDATIKEERTVPYLYGIGFSLLGTSLLCFIEASNLSILLWFSYFVNSIILIVINKYWKISAHTMGIAIPLGASFVLSGAWSIIFGIILLLVAWARYELKVHSISQLVVGAFVGFTVTYVLLNFI